MKCNRCDKKGFVVIKGEQLCWDHFDEVEKAKKDTGELPDGEFRYGLV